VGELGLGDAAEWSASPGFLGVRNLAGGVKEMGFGRMFGGPEVFKAVKAAKWGEATLA
jgi:hypothetical protein